MTTPVRLNLALPPEEYERVSRLAEGEKRSIASMGRYLLGLGCEAFEQSQSVGLAPATAVGAIAMVIGKLVSPLGLVGGGQSLESKLSADSRGRARGGEAEHHGTVPDPVAPRIPKKIPLLVKTVGDPEEVT
jgi:hypothetical protein